MGVDPKTAIRELGAEGADVLGANCSNGPDQMVQLMGEMRSCTTMPLIAQPNAGLPQLKEGKTLFSLNPDDFASYAHSFKEAGVNILGGCCGTTPQHMKKVLEIVKKL